MPANCRLIIAGSFQQAKRYADAEHLARWRYVRAARDLLGRSDEVCLVFIGTWSARPDAAELVDYARTMNQRGVRTLHPNAASSA